jgi:hypothetical protein
MKLTKGKLLKIRNKKNQSAKRIKKSNTYHSKKTKTFRNKKPLNLHNTSLKKYRGGQPGSDPKLVNDAINANASANIPSIESPINNESIVEPGQSLKEDVISEPSSLGQTPTTQSPEELAPPEELASPKELASPEDLASPDKLASPEELASPEDLAPPEDLASPKDQSIIENDATNNNQPQEKENELTKDIEPEPPVASAPYYDSEPAVASAPYYDAEPGVASAPMSIISESLENLTDYIAEKIANNVAKKMLAGTQQNGLNRDSFNAVQTATEIQANEQ